MPNCALPYQAPVGQAGHSAAWRARLSGEALERYRQAGRERVARSHARRAERRAALRTTCEPAPCEPLRTTCEPPCEPPQRTSLYPQKKETSSAAAKPVQLSLSRELLEGSVLRAWVGLRLAYRLATVGPPDNEAAWIKKVEGALFLSHGADIAALPIITNPEESAKMLEQAHPGPKSPTDSRKPDDPSVAAQRAMLANNDERRTNPCPDCEGLRHIEGADGSVKHCATCKGTGVGRRLQAL